jgi:hypothetical protein
MTTDLPFTSQQIGIRPTNAQYYSTNSIATQTLGPAPPTNTYEPGSPTDSIYSRVSRSAFDPVINMPHIQLSPTAATNLLPNRGYEGHHGYAQNVAYIHGHSIGNFPGQGQYDIAIGAVPLNRVADNRTVPVTQYISPGSSTATYQDYIYPDRLSGSFGMTNPMLHAIPLPEQFRTNNCYLWDIKEYSLASAQKALDTAINKCGVVGLSEHPLTAFLQIRDLLATFSNAVYLFGY